MAALLLIAAVLRLWRLEANGFGTEYYAAGVRSMLQGFSLFFYNAFDPAGFVSLDKAPVTFWIQAAFASVLGFSGWTIHLPQALAGVASVALLYRIVERSSGTLAGWLAGLMLATTPVMVAVDRSNNTDSWLVFFLLLAAQAALRGRGLSLIAAMALLGVAFNVKMLAALICGPALLVAWLMSSTLDWRSRLKWMTASAVVLTAVSLSWAAVFDLTPKEARPYAGSSAANSMFELMVVHNGLDRFKINSTRPQPAAPTGTIAQFELYDAVPTGPLRMANPMLAGQFAWLLPLAILGLVLVQRRGQGHAALALWGVWALTYGTVYSVAGGIFHLYYLSALAPAIAALSAIGAVQLWRRGPGPLAIGLGASAAWQIYLTGATLGWDSSWLGFPTVAVAAGAAAFWRDKRPPAFIGGLALMVLPLAWAMSAIFSPGNLTLPSASLPRALGLNDGRGPVLSRDFPGASGDPKLQAFLRAQRGDARFLVATSTALLAAPIIIHTGQPAMAFGGYLGRDPILSVDAFADRVRRGEVRYALVGPIGRPGSVTHWIRTNGKPVEESEWRSWPANPRRPLTLYKLPAN